MIARWLPNSTNIASSLGACYRQPMLKNRPFQRLFSLSALFLCLSASCASAHAEGYAGAFIGPSFVNEGYGTRLVVGAHGGMEILPQFKVGIYFSYESLLNDSSPDISETIRQYIVAIEPNYYPITDVGLYVGAKLGAGIHQFSYSYSSNVPQSQQGADFTDAHIVGGPAVGYHQQLLPCVSVGAEANFLIAPQVGYRLTYTNLLFDVRYTW